jgi:hypothetical protein
MIAPSDPEYKLTKLIKRGEATMDSEFIPLAEWIDKNYDVKTINIIYDTIDNGLRPRLQIIFEYYQEAEKFRNRYEYDEVKQLEIAKQFEKTLIAQRLLKKKKLWNLFTKNKPDKYKTKNILVIFSAFETIAKIETSWNIPESEIQKLQSELDTPDLWKFIPRYLITQHSFFIQTNRQTNTLKMR